ncbi:hypothetical protein D3C81_2145430 [compost metagenome]
MLPPSTRMITAASLPCMVWMVPKTILRGKKLLSRWRTSWKGVITAMLSSGTPSALRLANSCLRAMPSLRTQLPEEGPLA